MRIVSVIMALLAFLVTFNKPIRHFVFKDTVTSVVVTEKERVSSGDSSRFMVWTKDEVFENTDSFWGWKFNSADIHGKMPVGEACDFEVTGWRVPFLSWNRNILSANCAQTS